VNAIPNSEVIKAVLKFPQEVCPVAESLIDLAYIWEQIESVADNLPPHKKPIL